MKTQEHYRKQNRRRMMRTVPSALNAIHDLIKDLKDRVKGEIPDSALRSLEREVRKLEDLAGIREVDTIKSPKK